MDDRKLYEMNHMINHTQSAMRLKNLARSGKWVTT